LGQNKKPEITRKLITKALIVSHKFISKFKELEVSAFRLSISKSLAEPIIKDFSSYYSLKNKNLIPLNLADLVFW